MYDNDSRNDNIHDSIGKMTICTCKTVHFTNKRNILAVCL